MSMNLGLNPEHAPLLQRVRAMITDEIMPLEEEYHAEIAKGDRWAYTERQAEILEGLKAKAKAAGLWNFWLTDSARGFGLTTVDYAYFAEEMGRTPLGAEVFNCSAPDTGNMEVFERYGTDELRAQWLAPLLERDGDSYVLNGEKWWASGAGDPRCKVYIVMVRTGGEDAPKHKRHSMIVVPAGAEGIEVLRPMEVYGHDDAPHGHMHIRFSDVRVPAENLLLGEGRGFEIAQGRLGPGRIHHCMRSIGQAEEALALMCKRSLEKEAFGKPLAQLGANYDIFAECRMEIDQARLLCLKAAWMMDKGDARAAAPYISQIKVVAPRVALKVIDEAVQMFGAQGISQDTPLAQAWTDNRAVNRLTAARFGLNRRGRNSRCGWPAPSNVCEDRFAPDEHEGIAHVARLRIDR